MKDIYVSGASGVLYYLVDNVAESFVPGFDLDNYYFEIGAPSVPYVAAGELFGTSSPIFQAAQAVFYYGIPNVINSIVVSATRAASARSTSARSRSVAASWPACTSTGRPRITTPPRAPDSHYSTNGLSAIFAYVSTSISDSLPTAASISSSLSGCRQLR